MPTTIPKYDARTNLSRTEKIAKEKLLNIISSIPQDYLRSIPFLTMDRRQFTKSLAKIKLFESVLNVHGSIVECGSHRGNSLGLFSLMNSALEPTNFHRKIISFY